MEVRLFRKSILVTTIALAVTACMSTAVFADFGNTALRKGMTSEDVATLQKKLKVLGYFNEDKYTTSFGDATERAVKEFQAAHGYSADGVAGKATLKLIKEKVEYHESINILRKGVTNELVKELQMHLNKLGYFKETKFTAYFGESTEEAVKKFQKAYGLKADGMAGKDTMSYIRAKVNQAAAPKTNTASAAKTQPAKQAAATAPASNTKTAAQPAKTNNQIASRALVDFSKKYLGKPYVYGSASGKSFDCSGFSSYVMKHFGVKVGRSASDQFKMGTKVAKESLQAGDLVFFSSRGRTIGHVGVFIGDHKFIHASSSQKKVVVSDLRTYGDKYMGARRFSIKAPSK